jgi:cardiolipin synthase
VGELPSWLAILVVFRDVLIVGGVVLLWMLGQPAAIRPLYVSKVNTALQIGLIGAVLALQAAGLALPWLRAGLVGLVAASTLVSGAAYVFRTARPE